MTSPAASEPSAICVPLTAFAAIDASANERVPEPLVESICPEFPSLTFNSVIPTEFAPRVASVLDVHERVPEPLVVSTCRFVPSATFNSAIPTDLSASSVAVTVLEPICALLTVPVKSPPTTVLDASI